MIQFQRVIISDGTYHKAGEKPTGKIVGSGSMVVAGELVAVYMVELDRTILGHDLGHDHLIEITHLPVSANNLTPID